MAEMLELTVDMERFVEWLVMTDEMRRDLGLPRTLQEMADHMGYTRQTLHKWKQNEAFKVRHDQLLMDAVGNPDRLQSLFDKMFELALQGSVKHAELLLKMAGKIVQGQKVEVKVDTRLAAIEMSDDELQAEIARYSREALEERRELRAVND